MKYKVIDNFLDEEYFDILVTIFTDKGRNPIYDQRNKTPWFFSPSVSPDGNEKEEDNIFYMTHKFYDWDVDSPLDFYNSPYGDDLIPLLTKFGTHCLMRIKANLYPNTHIIHEHPMHTDYPYSHSGAILSLNTCDGYTKLKDGTKIDSVENRVLLHDPGNEHCSTTTTNVAARINLNINFMHEGLL